MRYLIISDIHANLYALQAVLADAEGQYDRIWCLGDVIGYGPNPNECIDLIANLEPVAVAGNHDWAALKKLDMQDFNADARTVLLWTQRELRKDSLDFLNGMHESQIEESDFLLVHGSPRHPIWEYVLAPSVAQANFAEFSTRYCLVGHTHSPAVYCENCTEDAEFDGQINPAQRWVLPLGEDRLIINPGSVGQPRSGDTRASYGILDVAENQFEFRRVRYPIVKTQRDMLNHRFPPRLISRLSFGW